jgi:hypothetical protein
VRGARFFELILVESVVEHESRSPSAVRQVLSRISRCACSEPPAPTRLQVADPRGSGSRRFAALGSADRMCKERSTCRRDFGHTSGAFRSSGHARAGC